jgi:hypothetical protein
MLHVKIFLPHVSVCTVTVCLVLPSVYVLSQSVLCCHQCMYWHSLSCAAVNVCTDTVCLVLPSVYVLSQSVLCCHQCMYWHSLSCAAISVCTDLRQWISAPAAHPLGLSHLQRDKKAALLLAVRSDVSSGSHRGPQIPTHVPHAWHVPQLIHVPEADSFFALL